MSCHLRLVCAVALSLALVACPGIRPPAPPSGPVGQPGVLVPVPGAKLFEVAPEQSLVRILVYRGGTFASAGHNHVIASHDLRGKLYLHTDLAKSAFQLSMPVATLEVDAPALRQEEGVDFSAQVPDTAKQGTRKNLLSEALLDGEHHPDIALTSTAVQGTREAAQAQVRVAIKDQSYELVIPVALQSQGQQVIASGEFKVKQTDLGLTPFSLMLGALQVQDQLQVKFRIIFESTPSQSTH